MNGRPIYSLEEDLQQLGVISEMEPDARKAQMFAKQQANKQAMFAKQQARKQSMFAKKNPGAAQMQQQDAWDDIDSEDVMDEARTKTHKMRGISKIMNRIRSRKYYKKMRNVLKRVRKSSVFKRHKAQLGKQGKARKGFRRVVSGFKGIMAKLGLGKRKPAQNAGVEFDSIYALSEMADSLAYDTNVGQYGAAYQQLGFIARDISTGFETLAEDYVSTLVDYSDVAEAAQGIANEALEFARAIEEHGDDVSGSDMALLGDHMEKLVDELAMMAEMYDVNEAAISLTEGDDYDDEDDEDEDGDDEDDEDGEYVSEEDLDEMIRSGVLVLNESYKNQPSASYSPRRRGGPYGESDLDIEYGHGSNPSDETFNVMHPLGISRVDQAEKLVLARQLRRETSEGIEFDEDDLL